MAQYWSREGSGQEGSHCDNRSPFCECRVVCCTNANQGPMLCNLLKCHQWCLAAGHGTSSYLCVCVSGENAGAKAQGMSCCHLCLALGPFLRVAKPVSAGATAKNEECHRANKQCVDSTER